MKVLNNEGYEIFFDEYIPNKVEKLVIALHGFSGDRTSTCIRMLAEKINAYNIGVVTFDWPAHGESPVDGQYLTIDNCLNDLDFMYNYIAKKYPNVKISLFATSFGGYLGLLYNHLYNIEFDKVILRAPAIRMHKILNGNIMDKEMQNSLKENGYFKFGYERVINITQKFINDLEKYDVFKLYVGKNDLNYYIIHGTVDDVVPIEDSILFSRLFGAKVFEIVDADHRFKKEGQLEKVVSIALDILK